MVRLFCELFYNSSIHKSFNNFLLYLVHLLSEAEQDAEQASKTRRGTSFGIAPVPVPVPAIEFGPLTKLEAYRHQKQIEQDAVLAAIDERMEQNSWISDGHNNRAARQRRENFLAMLCQMSEELADAINDPNPDLIRWEVPHRPENGWQVEMRRMADQRCREEERAGGGGREREVESEGGGVGEMRAREVAQCQEGGGEGGGGGERGREVESRGDGDG